MRIGEVELNRPAESRRRLYARPMRSGSMKRAVRLILAALAFSGVWLWLGDGETILGPVVIVVAVIGLWALSWVESSHK
jgi:hypothetical protein